MAPRRAPRAEPPRPDLPARLETRSVHALPIPLLAAGFVLSVAILVGSALNPFLYFRFLAVFASRPHWRLLVGTILVLLAAAWLVPMVVRPPDIQENRVLA